MQNEINCEDEGGNLKRVSFARTPVMSSYLLAFIVGEFDYVEERDTNGVLIRVYTPLGKQKLGQFALDVSYNSCIGLHVINNIITTCMFQIAVKTLPFYTDYFGVVYPLPKMDLIAIPDYAAIAMENWGLATYKSALILVVN